MEHCTPSTPFASSKSLVETKVFIGALVRPRPIAKYGGDMFGVLKFTLRAIRCLGRVSGGTTPPLHKRDRTPGAFFFAISSPFRPVEGLEG
jgi:hypothetical protein